MCALRWYVKCLYRHLFLEDTSEHARVTQKLHYPNCNTYNSKVLWATDPKFVCGLLKHPVVIIKTEPYLQCGEVLIRYETLYFPPRQNQRNICDITTSNHHLSNASRKKIFFNRHTTAKRLGKPQNLAFVAQGTLELYVLQFGRGNFLSDPCVFGCIF